MGAQDPPETGSQGEALIAGKIPAQPALLRFGGGDRSSKRRRGSRAGNGPPDQRRTQTWPRPVPPLRRSPAAGRGPVLARPGSHRRQCRSPPGAIAGEERQRQEDRRDDGKCVDDLRLPTGDNFPVVTESVLRLPADALPLSVIRVTRRRCRLALLIARSSHARLAGSHGRWGRRPVGPGGPVSIGPVLRACGGAGVSRKSRPWRRGEARPVW